MDKLISAKSLYKKFITNYKGERIPEYDVDNFTVTLTLRQIKKMIRDEPAAFDKGKVIEELATRKQIAEGEAAVYDEAGDTNRMHLKDTIARCYKNAIEIINKGAKEEK